MNQHVLSFSTGDGPTGMANIVVFNTAGYAPSAHLTEAFDVAVPAGARQSYFSDGLNNVNTFASLEVAHVSAQVLAVPEPSTWALLTVGFEMTGTLTRRRATKNTVSNARRKLVLGG